MRKTLLGIWMFFSLCAAGQNQSINGGLLPKLSLTKSFSETWQFNLQMESMQRTVNGDLGESVIWNYDYRRTDLQAILAKKLNPFFSVAGGFQYRVQNGANMHRTIQQVAAVQKKEGYRLGHRLRADQSFEANELPEFRFRYRLSAEFPLNGTAIDPKEFYLIFSDEPIFSIQGNETDLENRLGLNVGRYFNRQHKIEAGIDYRLDQFLNGGSRQQYWLGVGWYVNF